LYTEKKLSNSWTYFETFLPDAVKTHCSRGNLFAQPRKDLFFLHHGIFPSEGAIQCWNFEPSLIKVVVPARQATQPGGIGSLKSIPGLLKGLKIWAQEF
jgi:hypothetical protein